jgi:transposase
VDRRKQGSKHHLLTDGRGTPLSAILTAANRHDVTQLLPLVDAVPPVRGKVGRPRRRPQSLYADRAYDSQPHRIELRRRGIRPHLARRRTEHGSGLGVIRYVAEQSQALLHQFKRLRTRYDIRDDIHESFLDLACCVICWRRLNRGFF